MNATTQKAQDHTEAGQIFEQLVAGMITIVVTIASAAGFWSLNLMPLISS